MWRRAAGSSDCDQEQLADDQRLVSAGDVRLQRQDVDPSERDIPVGLARGYMCQGGDPYINCHATRNTVLPGEYTASGGTGAGSGG